MTPRSIDAGRNWPVFSARNSRIALLSKTRRLRLRDDHRHLGVWIQGGERSACCLPLRCHYGRPRRAGPTPPRRGLPSWDWVRASSRTSVWLDLGRWLRIRRFCWHPSDSVQPQETRPEAVLLAYPQGTPGASSMNLPVLKRRPPRALFLDLCCRSRRDRQLLRAHHLARPRCGEAALKATALEFLPLEQALALASLRASRCWRPPSLGNLVPDVPRAPRRGVHQRRG